MDLKNVFACVVLVALNALPAIGQDKEPGSEFSNEPGFRGHLLYGRRSPLDGYRQNLTNLIVGSTPFEQEDWNSTKYESTRVGFSVNSFGEFSNWQIRATSGSLTRDFWTLYGAMSCPPTKPYYNAKFPLTVELVDMRICGTVSSQEAEDWRMAQGKCIARNPAAQTIYFPLIPASFISRSPGKVTISDITARENLVGMPVSALCPKGETNWTVKSAMFCSSRKLRSGSL